MNYWGERRARQKAAACFLNHKKAGDIDETAARAFFLSGGEFGYPTVREGKNDGT